MDSESAKTVIHSSFLFLWTGGSTGSCLETDWYRFEEVLQSSDLVNTCRHCPLLFKGVVKLTFGGLLLGLWSYINKDPGEKEKDKMSIFYSAPHKCLHFCIKVTTRHQQIFLKVGNQTNETRILYLCMYSFKFIQNNYVFTIWLWICWFQSL